MAAPLYISEGQLAEFVDVRLLQQLSTDDGTDGTTVFATNATLERAAQRASSDVESHVLRGQIYTAANLDTLQTDGDLTLIGLVSDLTVYHLLMRRGGDITPAVEDRIRGARDTLKALARGEQVFGKSLTAAAAGVGEIKVISNQTRADLNMVSDSRFFPPRQDRIF